MEQAVELSKVWRHCFDSRQLFGMGWDCPTVGLCMGLVGGYRRGGGWLSVSRWLGVYGYDCIGVMVKRR